MIRLFGEIIQCVITDLQPTLVKCFYKMFAACFHLKRQRHGVVQKCNMFKFDLFLLTFRSIQHNRISDLLPKVFNGLLSLKEL